MSDLYTSNDNYIYNKEDHEKTNLSEEDLKKWATNPLVIGVRGGSSDRDIAIPMSESQFTAQIQNRGVSGGWLFMTDSDYATFWYYYYKQLVTWSHEGRVCGWVRGYNVDGSMDICLLGDDTVHLEDVISIHYGVTSRDNNIVESGKFKRFDFNAMLSYEPYGTLVNGFTTGGVSSFTNSGAITEQEAMDLTPQWRSCQTGELGYLYRVCAKYNGENLGQINPSEDYLLTSNPETTWELGIGQYVPFYHGGAAERIGDEIYQGFAGNMYDVCQSIASHMISATNMEGKKIENTPTGDLPNIDMVIPAGTFAYQEGLDDHPWQYAQQWKPYNLILTESLAEAKEYVRSGQLPTDAWLYPCDVENLPRDNPIPPEGDTPDSDDPGTDNNTPDDDGVTGEVTPPTIPQTTPNMFSNNNLYWLSAAQLEDFFEWFWDDAGAIHDLDLGDLWDKIRGLYNDLSSCIVNVRYFPVNVDYIGGITGTEGIRLGMITKSGNYSKIGKNRNTLVDLGSTTIHKKYKSFLDKSPYSTVSLYLPFYGFMELDIDLFDGRTIDVKAIYDHISGTVQYLIFMGGYIINTIHAKIAVDIPITLQSKNDRDSAIFQNVCNAGASIFNTVSSIGKGDIGDAFGSIANVFGSSTAPLKAYGAMGETGAFYAPCKCAIVVKRPTVSKPDNKKKGGFDNCWKSRVGQVCGKGYQLSALSGLTTIKNPYVSFGNTKNSESGVVKPTPAEIEEIYSTMEGGIIL